jgi:glycosyltransferase involved in cell wall biosynthesis
MKISIVIPMYNEERRIPSTLAEIVAYDRDHKGVVKEVIVVDDGSTDATCERVQWFAKKLPLRMIRHVKNEGKWAAIWTGITAAGNDACILLMDADGSASVWELDVIGEFPKKGEAVYGSRYAKGAVLIGKGVMRRFVSKGYRRYVRLLYFLAGGRQKVDDFQCPFKLFYVDDLYGVVVSKRFAGDIELTLALRSKIRCKGVTFVHKRGSKVPMRAIFTMAWETAKIAYGWKRRRRVSSNESIKYSVKLAK